MAGGVYDPRVGLVCPYGIGEARAPCFQTCFMNICSQELDAIFDSIRSGIAATQWAGRYGAVVTFRRPRCFCSY